VDGIHRCSHCYCSNYDRSFGFPDGPAENLDGNVRDFCRKFQEVHSKNKVPSFATVITGIVVGVPILFTDKTFVLDFTSIGTILLSSWFAVVF
jgi:amino acid transporter